MFWLLHWVGPTVSSEKDEVFFHADVLTCFTDSNFTQSCCHDGRRRFENGFDLWPPNSNQLSQRWGQKVWQAKTCSQATAGLEALRWWWVCLSPLQHRRSVRLHLRSLCVTKARERGLRCGDMTQSLCKRRFMHEIRTCAERAGRGVILHSKALPGITVTVSWTSGISSASSPSQLCS